MTLPPLVLDDLTWETLTDAARRRIPAASDGRWTLHAPVDPGITLLELLAYLLEQRLYRLDRTPDDLVRAVLELLGVTGPRPARPAATVLRLSADGVVVVPAGAVVSRDPVQQVTFALDDAVTVLPLSGEAPRLLVDGRDHSTDLREGRGVPLSADFQLSFTRTGEPAAPEAGTTLSLLLDLDAPDASPPSWHPDAVADVPPPAVLTWHWFDPGRDGERPVGGVVDGTAGLRRSGVVELPLPAAWCADGAGPQPAAYGLRVRAEDFTWSQPPILRQAVPDVAVARHAEQRRVTDADLGRQLESWRRLPGRRIVLPDAARRLLPGPRLRIRRGGSAQDWREVATLAFSGPGDRVFTVDREAGALCFGDGLTGAIPVPDAASKDPVVRVEYRLGGGEAGNGGPGGGWLLAEQPDPNTFVDATAVTAAEGGREPETVQEARTRATDDLATGHRAVTAEDYAALARATPGVAVARAHVAVGADPGYPCSDVPGAVTVRVLPEVVRDDRILADPAVPAAVRPDPGLLTAVRAHLAGARLLGAEVYVDGPRYRTVRLRAELGGRPADPARVRAALRLALRRYLDPVVGGDRGDGWPFGDPLRPTALMRIAQQAVADAADVVAVAVGLDGAEPTADCGDTPLRDDELPALASTTLTVRPPGRPGGAR
ncbi:putative baseplate assembly protein [Actinoplanes sp. OR16]|uniref:baseplate J/gp47 family protein n=1 Tax=Actinoplanes sp. OR16 TaxID=946334 RepID=UPI000F6C7180|nr:baseplate J/gp47 family protein [Actinoplanes sp. OR16]BBH69377.1 putative baseplate assembly protein [Actinoplanes sp. OR16]